MDPQKIPQHMPAWLQTEDDVPELFAQVVILMDRSPLSCVVKVGMLEAAKAHLIGEALKEDSSDGT